MAVEMNITNKDHVIGPDSAVIEIVEYADYQCPFCKDAYYVINELLDQLGDQVRFVFRNFPLTQLHQHALHAAVAAEASSRQDKFWEMHNLLFENQPRLSDEYLLEYAKELEMDIAQFEKDFSNPHSVGKVEADYRSGIELQVEGTPTIFINGILYPGEVSSAGIISFIEKEV